jgi:Rha family phage regulatory protein
MSQLALNLPGPMAARQSLFAFDGKVLVTSREVASRFGKLHKNVIRDIGKILSECPDPEFSQLNFEPRDYKDQRGKIQPEYLLTHNGFALLVMGFTGREALAWKIAFLQAFNDFETELHATTARYAAALDQIRPSLRPVVDGTLAGLKRSAIAAPLGKSCASVTYYRGQGKRFGLLPVPGVKA